MTSLMRENLNDTIHNIKDAHAHAGLLIQRGLTKWQDGEKKEKAKLIDTITATTPSEVYDLAFSRWLRLTYNQTNFATLPARIDGRLYTGLALGGTLETGVSTQHAYGIPFIAGSSIKGAVRAYAETVFALKDEQGNLVFDQSDSKKQLRIDPEYQPVLEVLFGKEGNDETEQTGAEAGYLIWHDAWWIPSESSSNSSNRPFVGEVVTTHHQDYYNGELDEPLDIESPIPNQQLAVQGEFYFVIEGVHAWAEYAKSLLEATLTHMGLGAKSASGYGYFNEEVEEFIAHEKVILRLLESKEIDEATKNLTENQTLIYHFTRQLKALDPALWHGKYPNDQSIEVDGNSYWFTDLFKQMDGWSNVDKTYALETLFLPYLPKFLGKEIKDVNTWKKRINPMKNVLNIQ